MTARGLLARRGRFVLDVPAFEADAGGTAVLGPNGAGKTTLLLALQGLIPSSGTIDRPARAAAVFARPAVLRGSALWNVAVVVRAVRKMQSAEAGAHARRALLDVGLADEANQDARTLSTGQRQRLALARALAVRPDVLFLDEPFANVDADARPALRACVRRYAEQLGCTVVLATSSLTDALALCSTAVVLRSGKIALSAPASELESSRDAYVAALVSEARFIA